MGLVPARYALLGLERHGGSHDLIHILQVFLFGAYKYPRELTWLAGVFPLPLDAGHGVHRANPALGSGRLLGPGDRRLIAGRVPLIGPQLVHFLLGGPIIAGETLTRFFALHVFVIPGLLLILVGVHLWLVIKVGINEWPMPGRVVNRERYLQEYQGLVEEDGEPFVPDGVQKDIVAAGIVLIAVFACAALFGPYGPNGPPDPTLIGSVPRPDFYFLSLFAVLALLPPDLETLRPARRSSSAPRADGAPVQFQPRARRAGGDGPAPCSWS